ncbi:MAG: DUF2293 domain-containing protein [Myxococcales bacterium]|nr:DUF2293 domain-containing protein [Myxococcales bacterium]
MAETRTVLPTPHPRLVRDAAGQPLHPPADWSLLPPGDAALTRRVRAEGDHWIMEERRGRKVFSRGTWAPTDRIERITRMLERERAQPAHGERLARDRARRDKAQAAYVEEFRREVLAFLAFAPRHAAVGLELATRIAEHATPVGSGTVARTARIPVAERAEAAVIAWMRHQTTAYDRMVIPRIKGERRETRRRLAERSRQVLQRYRVDADPPADCPLQAALARPAPPPDPA